MLKTKILAVIAIVYVLILSSRKLFIFICKIKKKSPVYLTRIYVPPKDSVSHWFSAESHPVSFRLGVKVIRKNRKLLGSFNFLKDIFAKQQLFSKIIYYVLLEIRSTLLMIMPLTVKNCIAYTFYLSCLVIK